MVLNILMSVLIVSLEYLFLGVLGFGIWGAALATCIGMIVCTLLALFPFFFGKMQLHFTRPRFSRRLVRQNRGLRQPELLK